MSIRKVAVSLMFVAATALVLAGCGTSPAPSAPAPAPAPSPAPAPAPTPAPVPADIGKGKFVSIGTSGAGGTYAIIGTALGKVIKDNLPGIDVSVENTPSGGIGNIRLLAKADLTVGIAGSDAGFEAYQGIGQFPNEKVPSLRTAWVGLPLQYHVIVLADSGINKVADLKGKSVGTCSAGTEIVYTPLYLKGHGIERTDYKSQQLSTGDAAQALKDGRIDAIACPLVGPAAAIIDLGTSRKIKFLPTEPEAFKAMLAANPWWVLTKIAKSDYSTHLEADVEVAGISSTIFTHEGVDADLMYAMTKAVLENNPALKEIHPAAASVSIDRQQAAVAGGDLVPPLHPGVVRYYKEKGLMK